jgi:uncharacterized protein involved in exopolysaccharide biosynthesis
MPDRYNGPPESDPASPPTVFDYLALLLANRRLLVLTPPLAAILALGVSLLMPVEYTAEAVFIQAKSSQSSLPSGLGALAGQFGISFAAGNLSDSPQFYAQLVNSRELRDSVLRSPFPRPGSTADSAALIDLIVPEDAPLAARLSDGRDKLAEMVQASTDRQTGTVDLRVTAGDPLLAAAVASRYVDLINGFNLERRLTQAHGQRMFVEGRLQEAEADLRASEGGLRDFLSRNRDYTAPALRFEYDQIQRQVQVRQEVYLTLRREFETARIQEINDTPVITVIDAPTPPMIPSGPHRVRFAILAALASLFLAVGGILVRAYLSELRRREPASFASLAGAWRASVHR